MGWRTVLINVDDTLQSIALRYMGHAKYWHDIALLNALRPPYIAALPALGVLSYGDSLLLPVPEPFAFAKQNDPFLTDLQLSLDGDLVVENGALSTVTMLENLKQALSIRVVVEKKSLPFHPEYGCYLNLIIGRMNRLSLASLAAFYTQSALLEDPRVLEVVHITSVVSKDAITIQATVLPVYGKAVKFEFGI